MIVTPVKTKAYAHCLQAMCPGYAQEELDVIKTTVEYQYSDNGADMFKAMVERLTIMLDFENAEDRACRHCGGARELSETPRPTYQALSGYDPMGLINGTAGAFNPNVVNTQADAEMAELRAQMKLQADQIASLLARAEDVPGDAA